MLFEDIPSSAKENSHVHPIQSPRIMNNVSRILVLRERIELPISALQY